MTALGWVALAVLAAMLGAEAIAWCRPVHRWMLRRAAAVLPVDQRDRYLEEWLAELQEVPDGPVTRSLWALRILLSRHAIAQAVGAPKVTSSALLIKRGLDLIVGGSLLLFFSPILVAAVIAIRLEAPGPALFRQWRLGRNGRPFVLLKLRTMTGGEVTRVGRVLRRYSLDEAPNLINVVRGDMTLIGPRPPLQHEAAEQSYEISWRRNLSPGVTGLSQVEGSDGDRDETVRLDRHYVETWSLLLDLKILWRTIVAILKAASGR